MSELRTLNPSEMTTLLDQAMAMRASASLRAHDSVRMLGQLHVCSFQAGAAICLEGAKHRDYLPPDGTEVTLSIVMGDLAISCPTRMIASEECGGNPPLLRTAWPEQPLEFHKREEVRVATPALPPLEGILLRAGQRLPVKLINLTETGMGLGLGTLASFQPLERVEVETHLPGGASFRAVGEVRHFETLEGDELPTRVGLVLVDLPAAIQDSLRSLIQARRMYLSQDLREN
jgi:hypothetical protein